MELWQSSGPVEGMLHLGTQQIAARVWGNADKPLLIALHGWLDNLNSFIPLAAHLQSDYHILAIDWPGHGLSSWRAGHYPLHWVDYLYDLHRLLDLVAPQQPVYLLGHSLGGLVASAYGAAYPERVKALVLLEALVPLFEDPQQQKMRLCKSFKQTLQKTLQGRHYCTLAQAVQSRQRLTGLEAPWCQLILERNLAKDERGSYWRTDPRLRTDSPQRLTFAQIEQWMQKIALPTLLLTGSEGYPSLTQLVPKVAPWFTCLTKVQLTGNHHLHMQNAEKVALVIKDFLEQTKCADGARQSQEIM
ncbi:alpha/beta fold hydrolase [Shewanella sp. YIC-542]|uniref:alpha/beta fold hydrolase n=1 Tax=Shewanella mytili TaxID=3377111 RepID=UPI00398E777C